MTLVLSYWSGEKKREMSWLDAPCTAKEAGEWGCGDAWMEDANLHQPRPNEPSHSH